MQLSDLILFKNLIMFLSNVSKSLRVRLVQSVEIEREWNQIKKRGGMETVIFLSCLV